MSIMNISQKLNSNKVYSIKIIGNYLSCEHLINNKCCECLSTRSDYILYGSICYPLYLPREICTVCSVCNTKFKFNGEIDIKNISSEDFLGSWQLPKE